MQFHVTDEVVLQSMIKQRQQVAATPNYQTTHTRGLVVRQLYV